MNSIIQDTCFKRENISYCNNRFLIGNGYFCVRGAMEEYRKENMPSVNMTGVYDIVGDNWQESVKAPNPLYMVVWINGEKFALPETEPVEHIQSVDITTAVHSRKTVWKTEAGNITILCEPFANIADQHIIGMKYTVMTDFDADIEIITGIDGDVWDITEPLSRKVQFETKDNYECVTGITGGKNMSVETIQRLYTEFECKKSEYSDDLSVDKKSILGQQPIKNILSPKLLS